METSTIIVLKKANFAFLSFKTSSPTKQYTSYNYPQITIIIILFIFTLKKIKKIYKILLKKKKNNFF